MRRILHWLTVFAGLAALGAPSLSAQDSGAAGQPRAPVYSLPPGPRVDPDPAERVQGPRVPGETAPRLIRPDSGTPQQQARPAVPPPRLPQVDEDRQPARTAEAQQRTAAPVREAERGVPAATGQSVSTQRAPSVAEPAVEELRDAPDSAPPTTAPSTDMLPAPPDTGSPLPSWLLLFAVVLLGGCAFWLWRRRSAAREEARAFEYAEPVEPVRPAPRPVPAMVPPAPKPAVAPGPPATLTAPVRLHVDFRPRSARLTPMGFTVKYQLRLANTGTQPANSVSIDMGIRAADSAAARGITAELETRYEIEALAPGEEQNYEGEIRLLPQAFTAYHVDQRMLLFPIVDLALRQGKQGRESVTSASFLIGQERTPPSAKMAPFRLDRGIGQFDAVGGRRIELSAAA